MGSAAHLIYIFTTGEGCLCSDGDEGPLEDDALGASLRAGLVLLSVISSARKTQRRGKAGAREGEHLSVASTVLCKSS